MLMTFCSCSTIEGDIRGKMVDNCVAEKILNTFKPDMSEGKYKKYILDCSLDIFYFKKTSK